MRTTAMTMRSFFLGLLFRVAKGSAVTENYIRAHLVKLSSLSLGLFTMVMQRKKMDSRIPCCISPKNGYRKIFKNTALKMFQ
ncbi:hypothetical protein SS49_17200 [Enterobacter hormaechei subsp. steigerwaltii]|nr:hypothetical protein SS49_17200 [Enterobacter hormaechei subsp. steigerwaltii]KZP64538.1 hypothetical protein A3462_08045 [Enterobacter bugandensis]